MPRQCYVIVNGAAGHGCGARSWPEIERALHAHGLASEAAFTTCAGHATVLSRAALRRGHRTIIVVGGDGTINEVVNGFFDGRDPIEPAAELGIVCCGTGADFIRTIGLPGGRRSAGLLAAGRTLPVDVGLATYVDLDGRPAQRFFLNFADLGMGGETVRRVNSTSKAFGGFASFLWGAVRTIVSHRPQMAEITIDGGEVLWQPVGDVVVANGAYFAGGMHVAPGADVADGLFDLYVLGAASKPRLLFDLLPRVYFGAHRDHPCVWSKHAQRIEIRAAESLLLDLDGELAGSTPATLEVVPGALRLIVPPGFASR